MIDPITGKDDNAPNVDSPQTQNLGGKVTDPITEGGTSPSPGDTSEGNILGDEKAKELEDKPKAENLTQSLLGVEGQINITDGGTRNSDKSLRQDMDHNKLNEMAARTAGPNPSPNREGNEKLKADLGFRPEHMLNVDSETNKIADELRELRNRPFANKEDFDKAFDSIDSRLRALGR